MKKIICILLIFSFLLPTKSVSSLGVSAKYACVIDALTSKVLFEKNAYEKHSMASTTKIMTALLAIEKKPLDDIVTVSANAAGTEGSSIYLKKGEQISLSDLLYGLMLASGNDAAIAIAEHVGGSVENFASMMTQRAKELGAKNTSFKNPNGLDEEGHYTTAYDLALITKAALENETFKQIVSTKSKTLSGGARTVTNHNKLLNMYEGCIGVKTGFTKKTGRCLVSAAEKNGFRVIAVTLNAPDDWNDHKNMLNSAFTSYTQKPLIIKDMILKNIPVECGDVTRLELLSAKDFYITLTSEGDLSDFHLKYNTPAKIKAPVKKGTKIGSISISYKEKSLAEIDLLAGIDILYKEPEKETFSQNLEKIILYILKM